MAGIAIGFGTSGMARFKGCVAEEPLSMVDTLAIYGGSGGQGRSLKEGCRRIQFRVRGGLDP